MITLSDTARAAIEQHAAQSYPHECVGLLVGRLVGGAKHVTEIYRAPNTWSAEVGLTDAEHEHSLRDRFYLDPRDYIKADRAARAQGLDIVGCYHSHPDHPAIPSERDRVGAQGVGGGTSFSFLIQSVRDGQAAELTSWLLSEDGARFIAEECI
ncbi:MAG TPA: M67 family metallopeptidase [Kouleothrix sp.]|uniref:M67 family metallopeptidase n=1 Tax=Kouleothrix sp. TaxID=2779161 RepID=UPI002B99708D|nr:M67 family metallopeptidase [Kouleothrix sp.]HRC76861.1 M67 family metallopeptidase [Kouleothrix sp.]